MPQNPYNPNPRPQNLQDPTGGASEPDTWWGGAWKGLKDYGSEQLQGVLPMLEDAARPENAIMLALPGAGMGGSLKGVSRAAESLTGAPTEAFEALNRAAPSIKPLSPGNVGMMDKMYAQSNPVFKGLEKAGAFGGERSTFSSAPQAMAPKIGQAGETAGEFASEFTPRGGEDMYNIARGGTIPRPDPAQAAYGRILQRLPQTAK